MLLIVDGYNMIGAWPELRGQEDLDKARGDLADMLADYAGYSGEEIILVFDGHLSGRARRNVERHAGMLDIVYTKDGETADAYIERLVAEKTMHLPRLARPIVRVATSDALEQSVVLSRGAVRLSAPELRRDLRASGRDMRRSIQRRAPVKPGALEGRIDPAALKYFQSLREGGKEDED